MVWCYLLLGVFSEMDSMDRLAAGRHDCDAVQVLTRDRGVFQRIKSKIKEGSKSQKTSTLKKIKNKPEKFLLLFSLFFRAGIDTPLKLYTHPSIARKPIKFDLRRWTSCA
jgi:hypothetical protein